MRRFDIGESGVRSILHVTPYYYSAESVIGGGERYCNYIVQAVAAVAARSDRAIDQSILSFAAETRFGERSIRIAGAPDNLRSLDMPALRRAIADFQVIHIHQCLTGIGLLVATLAREMGKIALGADHGGGEHYLVGSYPHVAEIFDAFHAQSEFARTAFKDFAPPTVCIKGPVDDSVALQPLDAKSQFAGNGVAAVGRFLPHKGYEALIDAVDANGPTVVIAGQNYDADYTQMLQSRAAGKPVSFRFDLTDQDVIELLANSQLFVHASQHVDFRGRWHLKPELLGLAPLEALCQGTPTLVSSAGSLPELTAVLGCTSYKAASDLKDAIVSRLSEARRPSRKEIRRDCMAKYGLLAFGARYMEFVDGFAS